MKYIYAGIIVPASIIIPIGAGLIKRSHKHKRLKIIFFYLVFAGIIDIVERLLGSRHINNLPLLHFYTLVEFLFILRFFQLILNNLNLLAYRLIAILMYLFSVFCIINFIFFQSIFQFNSYPRPIAALIIIGLSMFYFSSRGEPGDQLSWINDPLNWMVSGLLVYFGSSLFHFAFLNILYEKASLKVNFIFGTIHATLVMVMYLLFAVGFLNAKNER